MAREYSHSSCMPFASSGWRAAAQPQPSACSADMPAESSQRWLRKSQESVGQTRPRERRERIDDQPQLAFIRVQGFVGALAILLARPDRFLGLLAIFDVDVRAEPSHDVAGLFAKRVSQKQEPTIDTIRAPHAPLAIHWFTRRQARAKVGEELLHVVPVNRRLPTRAARLLEREAHESSQRRFRKSSSPSERAVQTNPGSASTKRTSSFSTEVSIWAWLVIPLRARFRVL